MIKRGVSKRDEKLGVSFKVQEDSLRLEVLTAVNGELGKNILGY